MIETAIKENRQPVETIESFAECMGSMTLKDSQNLGETMPLVMKYIHDKLDEAMKLNKELLEGEDYLTMNGALIKLKDHLRHFSLPSNIKEEELVQMLRDASPEL